jgi:hypothetical protein
MKIVFVENFCRLRGGFVAVFFGFAGLTRDVAERLRLRFLGAVRESAELAGREVHHH